MSGLEKHIVKIQINLDSPGMLLIYNRDETIWNEFSSEDIPNAKELIECIHQTGRGKIYCEATLDAKGILTIEGRTIDQSW